MLIIRNEKGQFKKGENTKDLIGKIFGKLTVFGMAPKTTRKTYWACRCDCGNVAVIRGDSLTGGKSRSCGCLVTEINGKHLMHNTRLYHIWGGMKARCYNKNNSRYKNYGAKDIKLCDEWLEFITFYNWAVNNGYANNLTIDRIDASLGYSPDNCRWITLQENSKMTNKNIPIKVNLPNGEIKHFVSISSFCKEYGISDKTVKRCLDKNIPFGGFIVNRDNK